MLIFVYENLLPSFFFFLDNFDSRLVQAIHPLLDSV